MKINVLPGCAVEFLTTAGQTVIFEPEAWGQTLVNGNEELSWGRFVSKENERWFAFNANIEDMIITITENE